MDWNVENDSTVEIFIFIYLYTCVKQFGLFPAALRILFFLLCLSSLLKGSLAGAAEFKIES